MAGGGGISLAAFPMFPRLAALRSSPRPFDTGNGAMMFSSYQSAGGIDQWRAEAFHIRGSFISIWFCSRSPTSFRSALRLSDTRNGTGACLLSLVPLSSLVAVVDGVVDGDGVPIDGVCGSGDGEHVIVGSNEVIGLGGGDSVVSLIDVLVIGFVGTGADGAGVSLRHHIGVPFVCFLSTSIRYHDTGNHIYKYEAQHGINTKPPWSHLARVISIARAAWRASRPASRAYPSRKASRILSRSAPLIPSRQSSQWQAGGVVSVSYRNAPFSGAHSSLPTNTKRNTARTMAFLFISRPTPSRRLSLIRRPQIVPRPQGGGKSRRR